MSKTLQNRRVEWELEDLNLELDRERHKLAVLNGLAEVMLNRDSDGDNDWTRGYLEGCALVARKIKEVINGSA